MIILLIFIDIY